MKVHSDINNYPVKKAVVTIGTFYGCTWATGKSLAGEKKKPLLSGETVFDQIPPASPQNPARSTSPCPSSTHGEKK